MEEKLLTEKQRQSIWLYCQWVAQELNEKHISIQMALKHRLEQDFTKQLVHDIYWIPLQAVLYGTDSTKKLKKVEEIDNIYDHMTRHFAEKLPEMDFVPFPHDSLINPQFYET